MASPDGHLHWQKVFERRIRPALEIVLAVGIVVAAAALTLVPVQVTDDAMAPTLNRGDWVLVSRVPYYLSDPKRGDIVAVAAAQPTGTVRLLRVVGLPGESVQIRAAQVLINRRLLEEPYLPESPTLAQAADAYEYRLTRARYVLLNDNRTQRSDSRARGNFTRDAIIGRAWLIVWPPERVSALPRP